MDERKSGSAICMKRLRAIYMLNKAAKKTIVLLSCADRTKTRVRQVSGSLAFLGS